MTDQELLALNAKGFIPGPGESEERFKDRVHMTPAQGQWVSLHLKELFDFEPRSLNVVYSNRGLALWQGAACWIEDGIPTLQLREAFLKGTYFGIYSREEILAHEAVHAARAAFEEPENEEFFAYASSEKKWRRVLGPVLKRPWEAWATLGVAAMGFFWPLLPIFWLGWGFWRLIRQHRRLAVAARVLQGRLKDQKKVRAVLFRLTDQEIRELAKGRYPEEDQTLRWRLIRLAYFDTVNQ